MPFAVVSLAIRLAATVSLVRENRRTIDMPPATLIRTAAFAGDNWEAPAGAEDASAARVGRLPYIYHGDGEPHWFDQPCVPLSVYRWAGKNWKSRLRAAAGVSFPLRP